jgi:uncharacterized YccA/Bax inhibitor family protein
MSRCGRIAANVGLCLLVAFVLAVFAFNIFRGDQIDSIPADAERVLYVLAIAGLILLLVGALLRTVAAFRGDNS